jgi:hypothetical protein
MRNGRKKRLKAWYQMKSLQYLVQILIAGEVIFVVCCLRGHNSLLPKHNILYTGAHENFSTCQKASPHAKKRR